MKSAIVTGSSGFIGRHLVRELSMRRVRVLAVDREPADPQTAKFLPSPHVQVTADLDDGSRTFDIITAPSIGKMAPGAVPGLPDVVFHLAATAGVHADSRDLIRDNITAAHYVIKWCGDNNVRLVFASSGAVYTPENRRSFYGLTKRFGEEMAALHIRDAPWVACRFSNVYGHQLKPKAVVGTWIDQIKAGKPISIHGDGTQARDFIHVTDIVSGLVAAAGNDHINTFDICTGRAVTIRGLYGMFQNILGRQIHARWIDEAPVGAEAPLTERPKWRSEGDLIWEPAVSLEDGLARTFADHGIL